MSARDVLHTFAARLAPTDAGTSPLGPFQVQALLLSSRVPEVKTLAQEVLRLQRLIARVDLFFATARRSGLPDSLDITSRNLAYGLIAALAEELAAAPAELAADPDRSERYC